MAIDREIVVHNAGIGTEVLLPKAVAEDQHVGMSGLVLIARENAPQQRGHAQSFKEIRTHRAGVNLQGLRDAGQREAAIVIDGHALKNVIVALPVEIVRG